MCIIDTCSNIHSSIYMYMLHTLHAANMGLGSGTGQELKFRVVCWDRKANDRAAPAVGRTCCRTGTGQTVVVHAAAITWFTKPALFTATNTPLGGHIEVLPTFSSRNLSSRPSTTSPPSLYSQFTLCLTTHNHRVWFCAVVHQLSAQPHCFRAFITTS